MSLDILYLGDLRPGQNSEYRAASLARLGHRVVRIDHRSVGRVRRLLTLPERLRGSEARAVRAAVESLGRRFDLAWVDKAAGKSASLLLALKQASDRFVHYTSDTPLGSYQSHEWRNFERSSALFSHQVFTKRSQVLAVSALGGSRTLLSRLSYEPSIHFKPQEPIAPVYDLVFLGMPHGHRAVLVGEIARRMPTLKVGVFGPGWGDGAVFGGVPNVTVGGGRFGDSYRETLWQARMALSLVTYWNADDTSRRLVEIAACGTTVLGEMAPGQTAVLRPDVEMLGFRTIGEAVRQIETGLHAPQRLKHLADAASKRIRALRLSNDELVQDIVEDVMRG